MEKMLYHSMLKDGKPQICGKNNRHTIRMIGEENGLPIYEVSYYIPGYGTDRIRRYHSLRAAKAAITKYDNM